MNTADTRHHLHLIRDHLGDLAAAQHTDPAPTWPPQRLTTEMWAIRDAQAAAERADRNDHALGDSPAPVLNLDAMQAHQDISEELLMLADIVAEACQLPVAVEHRADPERWRFNASWKNGPHWAAVYVDGRLAGDDLDGRHFRPIPLRTADEVARVARECWRVMARVLGIGSQATVVPDRPCPWCRGQLRLHQPAGEAPYVVCVTGWDCKTPSRRDHRGRGLWVGGEMAQLVTALEQRAHAAGGAQ